MDDHRSHVPGIAGGLFAIIAHPQDQSGPSKNLELTGSNEMADRDYFSDYSLPDVPWDAGS